MSRITGRSPTPVSNGPEDDVRGLMARADPQTKTLRGYGLYMTNGQISLGDLQNDRYSHLRFKRFAKGARRQ